jgi:hypothetical protein
VASVVAAPAAAAAASGTKGVWPRPVTPALGLHRRPLMLSASKPYSGNVYE